MRVVLEHLTKRFGDTLALDDVSLTIEDQELFFLLGPSGCGKTTLLRLIAGFYEPDGGSLWFGHRPMNRVPPHRRNTGMVFQHYALWPHLTVAANVAYGLEVRKVPAAARAARVQDALEIVQMGAYADRFPNQLSGGQQQRVALARALVVHPDVLLLDEPLSNLDARLRLEMRSEIRRIHEQTRITTVYVTHDQKESLSLADRLAVMRDGRIEQVGDPRAIYRNPTNRFVADFVGECNWLAGEVAGQEGDHFLVRTDFGLFRALGRETSQAGARVWLGFRPEAVEPGSGSDNQLRATVTQVAYLGEVEQYELSLAPGVVIKALELNPLQIRRPGEPLALRIQPQNLLVLPAP
jgi:iron(III) transport system ATP-binding protein